MKKGGQIQLSFSMIFSIFIIVATLAIAGYIISVVLNSGTLISCKSYVGELQKKVDRLWREEEGTDTYIATAPRGIERVCFGNLSQPVLKLQDRVYFEELEAKAGGKSNLFFLPLKSCEGDIVNYRLVHMRTEGFFCAEAAKGKVRVSLQKKIADALVKLST